MSLVRDTYFSSLCPCFETLVLQRYVLVSRHLFFITLSLLQDYRDRTYSLYSAYSFGSKAATEKQTPMVGASSRAKQIEDDLETVLDTTGQYMYMM